MARKKVTKNLENRLASLRDELLKELRVQLDQCSVSSSHHPTELMDIASDGEADDMAARLAEADAMKIEEIEEALERLREGTYGICRECGKAIPKRRLQVMPFATLCIACKEREEHRQGGYLGRRPYIRAAGTFSNLGEDSEDETSLEDDIMRNIQSNEVVD